MPPSQSRMDVLVVKTRPIDIAWPANAKEIAREILDYVTDGDKRPLLVHAFSVSSHVYAEMLDLVDAVEKYSSVRYRIVGQILDSCVLSRDSYEGIYSQASTNSFTQLFIKRVAETYFWVTNKYTMDSIIKVGTNRGRAGLAGRASSIDFCPSVVRKRFTLSTSSEKHMAGFLSKFDRNHP